MRLSVLRQLALAASTVAAIGTPGLMRGQSPLRHWTEAVESRFARKQPVITYALRVDSTDLTGFDVAMTVRGARDTVLLAMAAHPEYDDRYWRFVRDVRVESVGSRATVAVVENALWRVVAQGGAFTLRYRLALPQAGPSFRSAWQPFLAPTGGLVGGIHAFMYVVGQTLVPSHVTLDVPQSWSIATGLAPTSDPRTFYAPSAAVLVESPMLVGRLREWRFAIDGVPHRVVYWPKPDAAAFDTVAVVDGIRRIVRAAVDLFGRAPYREYVFQLQDGALGALEHPNSVSLGAPSQSLATALAPMLQEVAHEFVHAWNLMRIRPVEYGDVSYRTPPRSRGLWFSEGLTMFYADLLIRRAELGVGAGSRQAHLQSLINRYIANPGNSHHSAERVSLAAYAESPESLGDYTASSHLQGELLGAMLDIQIRHASGGRRSMDDVMRLMLDRYAGERGFTSRDVERTVADVCSCNVTPFFDAHIFGARQILFDAYLAHLGLRADVTWGTALGNDGRPVPDLRVYPYDAVDGSGARLAVTNPQSAWGRAGLHTGDRVRAVNGNPTPTEDAVRAAFRLLQSGDTARVEVERRGVQHTAVVVMAPFDRPTATIRDVDSATPAQRALRARWESGAP